jgi:hypothetical protein
MKTGRKKRSESVRQVTDQLEWIYRILMRQIDGKE